MKTLLPFLKPYRGKCVFILLVTLADVAGALLIPTITADMINIAVEGSHMDLLLRKGFLMFGVALLSGLLTLMGSWLCARLSADLGRDLREAVYDRSLAFSASDFETFGTASMITRTLNDVNIIQQAFVYFIQMILPVPMVCVLGIALAFRINTQMGVLILCGTCFVLLAALLIMGKAAPIFEKLQRFLDRRAPGRAEYATPRKEADRPEFLSGLVGNVTCGAPLAAIIRNTNTRSGDYSNLAVVPRPGHADYTAAVKYGGAQDAAGGGHFSGRLTAPLCIAGGVCLQLLRREGIEIISRIAAIAGVEDAGELTASTAEKAFPVVDDAQGTKMREAIAAAKAEGDSVGGIIEVAAFGLPVGLGDPRFGGMENRIAAIVFGVPAVKGVEFGEGFGAARLRGSENNDGFCVRDGKIGTITNHCGGILGGITNGMPLRFRAAVKPTPSIFRPQQSVNLETMEETTLQIQGRHDPCIVPRAVPVMEAAAAIAIYDALLGYERERM